MRVYDPSGNPAPEERYTEAELAMRRAHSHLRAVARLLESIDDRFQKSKGERVEPTALLWLGQEASFLNLRYSIDAAVREFRAALEAAGVHNADKYLPPFREIVEDRKYHMRKD
jgi:hypothetical protein